MNKDIQGSTMGKKRTKREKNFPRHVVTGVAVTSLAIGVLTNASGLENLFEPHNYKQFEKQFQNKNTDYAAGKGKDTDLADKNHKKQKNTGDHLSEALKLAQQTQVSANNSQLNLADNTQNTNDTTKNPNAVSISDTNGRDEISTNPSDSTNDSSSDDTKNPSSDSDDSSNNSSSDTTNSTTPSDDSNNSQDSSSDSSDSKDHETKPDDSSNSDATTDWEKEQLTRKDSEETKYGKITKLEAVITKEEYALGESFSSKDAIVTGTFVKDGKTYTKEVPFISDNTDDGYEVSIRTNFEGNGTAVFTYGGKSARCSYNVSSNHVNIHFYIYYNQNYYSSVFTGNLFDFLQEDIQNYLSTLNGKPYTFSKTGNIIDLNNMHHRMIAYLLNDQVKQTFSNMETGSYKNVNFLEEDKDGYLTTMLEGFRFISNMKLVDSQSYIYYPSSKDIWNYSASSKNVSDVVVAVPQGYKIRRIAQSEDDWKSYNGDQVLEQYTGNSENLEVPMGVTKIKLTQTPKNAKITALTLPESVDAIDTTSIAEHLPDLQQYTYANPKDERSTSHLDYKIIDGVLYSADGSTLLSVPPGRTKKLVIPSTVTTLAKDCFKNVKLDKIYFEDTTAPSIAGDTGYRGKIIVPETDYDQACKDYMFRFGTECSQIAFVSSDTEDEKYTYDTDTDTICKKDDPQTLCAISPNAKGLYTVDSKYTTIDAGAFYSNHNVTDIDCGNNIKKLKNCSLLLSSRTGSISFKNSDVEIEPYIFGNPKEGAVVPDIKIYVYGTDYDHYLEKYSKILNPVYGDGTAKKILSLRDSNIIYEDGVKYEKYNDGSQTRYRVLRVYETDKTAMKLKDGTTTITDGAFDGCKKLEILYLPSTMQEFQKNLLDDCANMETIISEASSLSISITDTSIDVFKSGSDYQKFLYENGIVYGQSIDGTYTLLNIASDTAGEIAVRKNTKKLYNKAFASCNKITSIRLLDENALEEIGAYCFENNKIITSLDFSMCDHLTLIGEGAFKDCTYLSEVKIPDQVSVFNDRLFKNCINLTSVTANGVTQIKDEVFTECMMLQNLLGFDNLTSIGDLAFYNCQTLRNFISGKKLTKIGEECFGNCVNLEKINLNGTLTAISRYCFSGCVNLTEFSMSNSQNASLKVIGVDAFANCRSLTQLDFSQTSSLTQLGEGCFSNCTSMLGIKFSKSLNTIAADSFSGCTNLSELQLNSTDVVTLNSQIFGEKIPVYLHVLVPEEVVESYIKTYQSALDQQYGDGTTAKLFGKIDASTQYLKGIQYEITDEGLVLKKVTDAFEGALTVPEDTIRIADDAFSDCQNITALTIPYGSKMELGDRCFKNCKNLKTLIIYGDIPSWGEETFMGCNGLNRAIIGYSTSTSTIPKIGTRAFMDCTGLSTSGAVTLAAKISVIGKECFSGCSNLAAFSYTKGADGVYSYTAIETIEDSAFENCTKLPGFLTSGFTGLKTIGKYAFKNCSSMTGPSVPKNVTSIGEGCFMNCTGVSYISFYGSISEYPKDCFKNCTKLIRTGGTAAAFSGLKKIGESAYEGCTSLTSSTSWYLGRYTNLEEIDDQAFKGCSSLGASTLSAAIRTLGCHVFDGCTKMDSLTFQGSKAPSIGAFSPDTMADNFLIKVPDSKESEDSVYKEYLETLKSVLGSEEKAYNILDSISDGAKDRNTPAKAEEVSDTKNEDNSDNDKETNE